MIYCKKCTYPMIAVNLSMSDELVCSGCVVHEEKMKIDWSEREKKFKKLLLSYKSKDNYDCIIHNTIHCEPNFFEASLIKFGLSIAIVFITTLSAPAFNLELMSCKVLIFPPIERGTLHILDKSLTISIIFDLLSLTNLDLDDEDPIMLDILSKPYLSSRDMSR